MGASDDTRLDDARAIESIIENRLRRQHHKAVSAYEAMMSWPDDDRRGHRRDSVSYQQRVRRYDIAQARVDELEALAKDLGLR